MIFKNTDKIPHSFFNGKTQYGEQKKLPEAKNIESEGEKDTNGKEG